MNAVISHESDRSFDFLKFFVWSTILFGTITVYVMFPPVFYAVLWTTMMFGVWSLLWYDIIPAYRRRRALARTRVPSQAPIAIVIVRESIPREPIRWWLIFRSAGIMALVGLYLWGFYATLTSIVSRIASVI